MKKTLAIAGLVLWIFGSGWYYTCKIKERCYDDSSPGGLKISSNTLDPESINPLMFNWESEKPLTGSAFLNWRDSLTALVKPGSILQITGFSNAAEKNLTNESDLGLARAKMTRALFPDIPDSLVNLVSQVDNGLPAEESKPQFAVKAGILVSEKDGLPDATTSGNFIIHFPGNSSERIADSKTDLFLENLASTLRNSAETVEIIGHTDNIGSNEVNQRMGLLRANSIRTVLIAKGVQASKITATSRGEEQPASINDTEDGRAKNRRTEIIVK